jgi:hypothetical protein
MMKLQTNCIGCLRAQMEKVLRFSIGDLSLRKEIADEALAILENEGIYSVSPPEAARDLYAYIAEKTGNPDPYRDIKKKSNDAMLSLLSRFYDYLNGNKNSILAGLKLAVTGNIIDYGIAGFDFSTDSIIEGISDISFFIDESAVFQKELKDTFSNGNGRLLYILDNAGEVVLDGVFIECLKKAYPELEVTVCVRGGAVINDCSREDIIGTGLDSVADVIDTGSDIPGIPAKGSDEFEDAFFKSGIIIAKGQGNFETSRPERKIFHLFKVKCDVVSNFIDAPMGSAVFCYI